MTADEAVREWVSRRIRSRGHAHTRDDVRNIRFGIESGWVSDVTPAEADVPSIACEVRSPGSTYWHEHHEDLDNLSPVLLIEQCLAIQGE